MSSMEKMFGGLVAIAMVTTLILPKRQTPAVLNATGNLISKSFGAVMGTGK